MGQKSSDELLPFRVPDTLEQYHIGLNCAPVTIYSQQIRALNLAYLLSKRLESGATIVVIGAGIAGLTFSAAALHLGFNIRILEKSSDVLSVQRGNLIRWIHPTVYDWPEGEFGNTADLPFFNWHGDYTRGVAARWLNSWESIVARYQVEGSVVPKLEAHFHAVDISTKEVDFQGLTVEASWSNKLLRGHALVFAIGFGLEAGHSYWDNDSFDQHYRGSGRKKWVVSGLGDGGLVDFLRLTLADFRQDRLIVDFFSKLKPQIRELKDRENRILSPGNLCGLPKNVQVYQAYREFLKEPSTRERLQKPLSLMRRKDTVVTLIGRRSPVPLRLQTLFINRLMVVACFEYLHHLYYEQKMPTMPKEADVRVVLRHGPVQSTTFPQLKRLQNVGEVPVTKIWPAGTFAEPEAISIAVPIREATRHILELSESELNILGSVDPIENRGPGPGPSERSAFERLSSRGLVNEDLPDQFVLTIDGAVVLAMKSLLANLPLEDFPGVVEQVTRSLSPSIHDDLTKSDLREVKAESLQLLKEKGLVRTSDLEVASLTRMGKAVTASLLAESKVRSFLGPDTRHVEHRPYDLMTLSGAKINVKCCRTGLERDILHELRRRHLETQKKATLDLPDLDVIVSYKEEKGGFRFGYRMFYTDFLSTAELPELLRLLAREPVILEDEVSSELKEMLRRFE